MARSFYSLIQYCPNRSRLEAMNVGLVLLYLEPHNIRVKTMEHISDFSRIKKAFNMSKNDVAFLKSSCDSMSYRLKSDPNEFKTIIDLLVFIRSRANDLRLTEPRLAITEDVDADFNSLYDELVTFGAEAMQRY